MASLLPLMYYLITKINTTIPVMHSVIIVVAKLHKFMGTSVADIIGLTYLPHAI